MDTSNQDTINLLKKCDAGSKMAVSAIDETLENIHNVKLKELLEKSKTNHTKLGNDLHLLLEKYNESEKEPSPIAKGMSFLKTNLKLSMHNDDATIADLMTDGCNMGIKSLTKYLNQYSNANNEAKSLAKKLISIEEDLCNSLKEYL